MLKNKIALNIRAYRKMCKLTQSELASRLKTSRQHISEIECCKRGLSVKMLEKIAKKLHVEPYQLLK
ncbi:helix-turn-helix domain-containing protein [Staphylococcus pseudintermedius]|uniref:helix-turn-helix domain-containing protein n=1 Tax=Staphylococcus pseudintermedius TaxID=283734 RepID=UPI00374E07F3